MNASPHAGARNSPWLQAGRLAFAALYAVTLLVALRWGFSNLRQINPENRAVVLRMGVIARTRSAGLLLAWPQPFEQVVLLPSAESVIERHVQALLRSQRATQSDLATSDDDDAGPPSDALAGSGYLLTGDAGIVQLDVRVFFKVTDPRDYVLQADHVLPALDRLVTRAAVRVCAARDLDAILVARPELVGADSTIATQRERLRGDLVRGVNDGLAGLKASGAGIGIEIVRVDLQSTLPRDTSSAFNAVLTASQQAEKAIAEARTDAAWATQTANQTADRALEVAHAQASERLAKAQTDTSAILLLAQSIKDGTDPGLPLRMYRERMRAILAKTGSVTTIDPKDASRLIIPGAAP